MADFVNTILSRYKADTSDHKRKLRDLSGEERKRHKAMLDQMDKQNKSIDGQIAMWGKVAAGVAAVTGAVALLSKGFDTYATNSRLRAANVNTDLQGLRKATRGLVDDTRLLEFSAKAMNGTFALTQKETEAVLQGAIALRKTMGIELVEALQRVEQAVNEGNVEPLKQLGITLKATSGTAEASKEIVKALSEEYGKLGGNVNLATDAVDRSKTDFKNAMDEFMESMGRLAVALTPVVQLLADAAGFVAKIAALTGADTSSKSRKEEFVKFHTAAQQARFLGLEGLATQYETSARGLARSQQRENENTPLTYTPPDIAAIQARARGQRGRGGGSGGAGITFGTDRLQNILPAGFQPNTSLGSGRDLPEVQAGIADIGHGIGALSQAQISAFNAASRQGDQSFLATIFGPVDEFSAYASAFGALTNAVQSSVQAWVTGQESMGSAFKKAIAGSLVAVSGQMAVEAVKHAAFAIGSAAFYDFQAAGRHAAAAAQFAAGATIAGVVARKFGAADQAPQIAPSTSGLGAPAGGGQGGGGRTSVFILGENFDDRTAREREAAFRRRARSAGLTFEGDVVEQR